MGKKKEEQHPSRQHDARILREGDAICTEGDLRELINTIYSGYQYRGVQYAKLANLIDFLRQENNRFIQPELVNESKRLSDWLDTFDEFLKSNFSQGEPDNSGNDVYLFKTEETSSETEAFLIEFQLVSLDVEKAYSNYRAAVISQLKI
jgi:hypothetical protein